MERGGVLDRCPFEVGRDCGEHRRDEVGVLFIPCTETKPLFRPKRNAKQNETKRNET